MKRRGFLAGGLAGAYGMVQAEYAGALAYYSIPSDLNCAVLYCTWCGSSRDAAVWISEGMGGIAAVFDVREQPDLTGFDHIIVGGAIRSNVTSGELQAYAQGNKDWLKDRVCGLFAVCGNMGNPVGPQQTVLFIDNHLAPLCGAGDVPSAVFNGRITKSLMEPDIAQMMAVMDDYDHLGRAKCMAFGATVLAGIQ